MPQEYIDFRLIKELYHCLPDELDRQDNAVIEMHRRFMEIDLREDNLDARRAEQRLKLRS